MAVPAGKKLDDQSPPLLIHCWALLVFEFHHFSKSPQLYKAFSPRATIWTLSSVKTINKWFSWSGTFLSFISIMDVYIKYSCFQFFLLILNIICFGKEKNKQSAIHFSSKTAGLIRHRCIMFYSEMLVLTWKHRKQFRQPLIVTSKFLAHTDAVFCCHENKSIRGGWPVICRKSLHFYASELHSLLNKASTVGTKIQYAGINTPFHIYSSPMKRKYILP